MVNLFRNESIELVLSLAYIFERTRERERERERESGEMNLLQ